VAETSTTCWCGRPTAPGSDRCDGHHWLERVAFRRDEPSPPGDGNQPAPADHERNTGV